MRSSTIFLHAAVISLLLDAKAGAQDPPPRIGPLVVDLRGTLPKFPSLPALAGSRGLSSPEELPGRGIGVDAAVHVYPFSLGRVTVGLGGRVTLARSHRTPAQPLRAVTAHYTSMAPQLSLNFGTGDGWSYISGGIGASRWSSVPDGSLPQTADEAWARTFDYGGGARWFAKPRVAFHIDVRVHAITSGPPQATLPGSPRMQLFVMGAGVSIR
jgi:hypothetical protein